MSRFRILAIFATLAALVAVLAACGGSGDDPETLLENATLEGVESGRIDFSLHAESDGSEGGNFDISVSGPFQGEGAENLPQLDLDITATGDVDDDALDFDAGLTLLPDRAYVGYDGTEYEVDPTTFNFIKSSLEQAQQGSDKNASDPTACQDAVSGLQVDEIVKGLKDEGSVEVDGTSTTKLSGELDVGRAIGVSIELVKDPACSAQLEAAGPISLEELEKAKREVSSAVKRNHVELYVGDDDIIRKFAADFTVSPKGKESVEVDFQLSLGEVNEEQKISAPSGAVKPVEKLFLKLGINPLEVLEELSSSGGLESLLEKLDSQSLGGGGGSDDGGAGEGGGDSGSSRDSEPALGASDQQAYSDCLKNAKTPVDLQNCASLSG